MAGKNKQSQNSKMMIVLLICAVVIIIFLAVIAVLLIKGGDKEEETSKRSVVVNEDNVEEVVEEIVEETKKNEIVPPGNYIVTMCTDWHFANGDEASDNARVENDAMNTNDVYFDVFLAEDESNPIYESPIIPLGGYLDNIKLDTPLDAGVHDCIIVYHLVDENQQSISTLRIAFKITVDA